jgi:hypothetical protein
VAAGDVTRGEGGGAVDEDPWAPAAAPRALDGDVEWAGVFVEWENQPEGGGIGVAQGGAWAITAASQRPRSVSAWRPTA